MFIWSRAATPDKERQALLSCVCWSRVTGVAKVYVGAALPPLTKSDKE